MGDIDIGNIKVFHQPRNRIAHNLSHRLATRQAFTPGDLKSAVKELDRLQVIEYEHQAMVAQQAALTHTEESK